LFLVDSTDRMDSLEASSVALTYLNEEADSE